MTRFVLRRLGAAVLLLWMVLTATFFLVHVAPGDPFALLFNDPRISPERVEPIRRHYGLDQPLPVQYLVWLRTTLSGDWGTSLTASRPVAAVIAERIPNTLLLMGGAVLIEYVLGLTLGLWSASRPDSRLDHLIRGISMVLFSVPIFVLALIAIEVFAVHWPIFPAGQVRSFHLASASGVRRLADLLHHLALPALVLGLGRCAAVVRLTRNGLLDILRQDYVRTARAVGLPPGRILRVHALRNALGPLIQRFGLSLPLLLSGSLIIEVIFTWPGLGQLLYLAILERDYPLILAATALSGAAVVTGNLLADLLQAWVDPKVRLA